MDQMDPPLSFQTDILPFGFNLELAFDTSGLEELIQEYDYLYDGMVQYSIEELVPVAYDEDDVLEQKKNLEPDEIGMRLSTLF